jgi:hypothetical protein
MKKFIAYLFNVTANIKIKIREKQKMLSHSKDRLLWKKCSVVFETRDQHIPESFIRRLDETENRYNTVFTESVNDLGEYCFQLG